MNDKFARTRRVKMLMVNPVDFMFLFTKGLRIRAGWKILKGLPADATLVNVAYEPSRGAIILVVESTEYDEVERGVLPPYELIELDVQDKRFRMPDKSKKK